MNSTRTTTYRTGVRPCDARVLGAVRPGVRERLAAAVSHANPRHAVSPNAIAPTATELGTTGGFVAMWQSTKCTSRLLGAAT